MLEGERKLRREILRTWQAAGMSRADARRRLYGPSWRDKAPTRRAMLAAMVRDNAAARKAQAETDDQG